MRDKLSNDIKPGDRVLIYGVNTIDLATVDFLLDYNLFTIIENTNQAYASHKCIVVNEQIKYNIETFPERFI